jgi:ferredoxin
MRNDFGPGIAAVAARSSLFFEGSGVGVVDDRNRCCFVDWFGSFPFVAACRGVDSDDPRHHQFSGHEFHGSFDVYLAFGSLAGDAMGHPLATGRRSVRSYSMDHRFIRAGRTGIMRYLENAVTLEFVAEKCNGCGLCVMVCPHEVFRMDNKRAMLYDRGACMECGACAKNCERGAISVRAGVGCAAGVLNGILRGTEPTCDCGGDSSSVCC